jgi:uncharacterized protein YndB with AHSA1/START domain
MIDLPHQLERTIVIRASRETVFRFFTESDLWAAWWGAGSTIGTRPGERVYIRYSNGVEASGELVEVDPPERIVFTYGFVSGNPIPVGASRATITLEREGVHTRLRLTHAFADPIARDHHIQGWRYQLSVFANTVADEIHRDAGARVDAWFAAWAETDADERARALGAVVSPSVCFRDKHSLVETLPDLNAHIGAYQVHMPHLRITRCGEVRQCQGTALADWTIGGANGKEYGTGTNVFEFGPDRLIESVTGLWSGQKA